MEWRASHILVKDRSLADFILKKLKSGENFSRLAKTYSTCPSKSRGGDLGWFTTGKMVKEFENAVKKMTSGGISGLVKTRFGYHIIKKTGQR
jgi:peptidyl-prolyl cis-trans isomerase C